MNGTSDARGLSRRSCGDAIQQALDGSRSAAKSGATGPGCESNDPSA